MSAVVTSGWFALGALVGLSLLVVWMACLCHRLVHCPYCGGRSRCYVGFFSELRTQAREIGPVPCKYCQTPFRFVA